MGLLTGPVGPTVPFQYTYFVIVEGVLVAVAVVGALASPVR